jgi:hypothetical protein
LEESFGLAKLEGLARGSRVFNSGLEIGRESWTCWSDWALKLESIMERNRPEIKLDIGTLQKPR